MVTEVRFTQPLNTSDSINFILPDKSTEVRPSQSENAPQQIYVTLSGMVTVLRLLQF